MIDERRQRPDRASRATHRGSGAAPTSTTCARCPRPLIGFSEPLREAQLAAEAFLRDALYTAPARAA